MDTRADVIRLCMGLPDSYEDYPFDDPNWTAMRHKTNHKTYAFLFERQGHLWVNVKAEPQWGDHWVSIILDGSMTEEQVFQLIAESYTLTQPKRAAKAQSE